MTNILNSIWHAGFPLSAVNASMENSLEGNIGIQFTEVGCDYLSARMPVDARTRQAYGMLHGGASVVLAETLASWAASYTVDPSQYRCSGQEINANHVRAAHDGFVYGIARPLHLGRSSQVWDVKISNDEQKLVCVSRVTMAVIAIAGSSRQHGLPRPVSSS